MGTNAISVAQYGPATTEAEMSREKQINPFDLAASIFDDWMDESGKILYDEKRVRAAGFIGLVGRTAVLYGGPPGGGKSQWTGNFYRLIDGADQSWVATIPPDSTLQPKELTGFEVNTRRQRGSEDAEVETTQIDAIVKPEHRIIDVDELTRVSPWGINAALGIPELRQIRSGGRVIDLPNFQVMLSTMNPTEDQEATFPVGLAIASRHAIGAVVGYDTTLESEGKLLANELPDVNKVRSVVSERQLQILRDQLPSIVMPPEVRQAGVLRVAEAERQILTRLGVIEKGRMIQQVGLVARINAMIRGKNTMNQEDVNVAINLAMASRVAAKARKIDTAPKMLQDMHQAVVTLDLDEALRQRTAAGAK